MRNKVQKRLRSQANHSRCCKACCASARRPCSSPSCPVEVGVQRGEHAWKTSGPTQKHLAHCILAAALRISWQHLDHPPSKVALCGPRYVCQGPAFAAQASQSLTTTPASKAARHHTLCACVAEQLAAKADLSRLERLEQQVDAVGSDALSLKAKQVHRLPAVQPYDTCQLGLVVQYVSQEQHSATCLLTMMWLVTWAQHEAAARHDDLSGRLEQLREQVAALELRVGYNPALTAAAGVASALSHYGTSPAGGASAAYQRLTLAAAGGVTVSGSRPGSAGLMMGPGTTGAAGAMGGSSVLLGSPRGAAAALLAQVNAGREMHETSRQCRAGRMAYLWHHPVYLVLSTDVFVWAVSRKLEHMCFQVGKGAEIVWPACLPACRAASLPWSQPPGPYWTGCSGWRGGWRQWPLQLTRTRCGLPGQTHMQGTGIARNSCSLVFAQSCLT
jgi:hypothetical protein